MKTFPGLNLSSALFILIAGVFITGCGETETETQLVQPTPTSAASSTSSDSTTRSVPVNTRLSEAQAALKARNYDSAADSLLTLQNQTGLTPQEAAAVASQMQQLQADLSRAIANGDAKALAAEQKLRQSSMAR